MAIVIVITGSTRGIGYGLADSFLAQNCTVVISGRFQESVDAAVEKLSAKYDAQYVYGIPCDVSDYDQVQQLWKRSVEAAGKIDIWINNAGYSGEVRNIGQVDPEQIQRVIDTNITGTVYGAQVAVEGMKRQGFGSIYIMEGAGSDGRIHMDGLALYGTSKYGLNYFARALTRELKETPILVGSLRPGMVITNLVTDQFADRPEDWEKSKKIFNIIADRVETVTPWLADQILKNKKSGVVISWSSTWKIAKRFIGNLFKMRDIFYDE